MDEVQHKWTKCNTYFTVCAAQDLKEAWRSKLQNHIILQTIEKAYVNNGTLESTRDNQQATRNLDLDITS